MRNKKKFKRKFTFALLILFIVSIGLVVSSSRFIRVSVNSESIDNTIISSNFNDTTTSPIKISLSDIRNNQSKNVILFSSSWCGSCGKLIQDLNNIAQEYPSMNVYIMDLEADRETANTLEVPVTPTLVLLENGKTKNYTEVTIDTLPEIISDFNRIGIR